MAIGVSFDKAQVQRILSALDSGDSIHERWDQDTCLLVAGTCLMAAYSQGPPTMKNTDLSQLHPEHAEMVQEAFTHDLHAAIGWYMQRAFDVRQGTYDEAFEERHHAIVHVEDGKRHIKPIDGFKDPYQT